MIKDKISTINQKIASASLILIIAGFLGHLLSLFKEIIIADRFGISSAMDAYYAATTIPNLTNNVLISTFGAVFIPIFIKYKIKDKKLANRFSSILINYFSIFIIIGSLVIFLLAPWIIRFAFYGFTANTTIISVKILKIISFTLIFSGLIGILTGILNAYEHFTWPAFSQMIITISIIIFILLFIKQLGIMVLPWGILCGLIIQLLTLIPVTNRKGFQYSLDFNWRHPAVLESIKLGGIYFIAIILNECNLLVDRTMASYLSQGSIAALGYAGKLIHVPLIIFSSSIATAAFPFFSAQIAIGKINEMKDSLSKSLRMAGFIFIPLTIMLSVLSRPIIQLIYERGIFTPQATQLTSLIFICYSFQFFFYTAGMILSRVFLGLQDIISLVKIGIISVILNILLNLFFIKTINPPAAGIALSTSVVYFFTFIFFFIILKKKIIYLHGFYILKGLIKVTLSSIIMGLIIFLTFRLCNKPIPGTSLLAQFFRLTITATIGVGSFILISILFRTEEIWKIRDMIKDKINTLTG